MEKSIQDFKKSIYEPEHTEAPCWCNPVFSRETDEKLHITHNEQRNVLTEYILDMVAERQDQLQASYEKAVEEKDEESANTYTWGIALLNNMFFPKDPAPQRDI